MVVSQNISSIGIDKDIAAGWFPRIYLVQVWARIQQQGGFLEYIQYRYGQGYIAAGWIPRIYPVQLQTLDKDKEAGWFPRIFQVKVQPRIYESRMPSQNIYTSCSINMKVVEQKIITGIFKLLSAIFCLLELPKI